jgi:hypothetical protein
MNYNNLAQKTNYIAGSDKLDLTPFYLTTVNIPGISFSHPEMGGRYGSRLNVTGDTLTYNALSFEMLVDEDFNVYHEFMDKVFDNVNPESGTFAAQEFDFWIEVNNNKGNKLFKIEFYNCRIDSLGDILLDSQDDITEHLMSIDIKYDYYKIVKSQQIPTLA